MLADLLLGAMALDASVFDALVGSPRTQRAAALILIIAGLSRTAAQTLALVLNAVRPVFFVLSVALNCLLYAAGVALWAGCIWVIAVEVFELRTSPNLIFAVIALGHAPYVLGFLSLAPYLGAAWDRLLGVWTLLCIVLGLVTVLDLPFWAAAGAGFSGWVLSYLLSLVLSPLFSGVTLGLRRLAAGKHLFVTGEDLIGELRKLFPLDTGRGGRP